MSQHHFVLGADSVEQMSGCLDLRASLVRFATNPADENMHGASSSCPHRPNCSMEPHRPPTGGKQRTGLLTYVLRDSTGLFTRVRIRTDWVISA
jgi:hypothetical protein